MTELTLIQKILELHGHLRTGGLAHGFGGALALAWCTERARATIDIDVNVFVNADVLDRLIQSLPAGVAATSEDSARLVEDGQPRLWWGSTPVDIFLNTTPFHEAAAHRIRWEEFAGVSIPFLACRDLAVFKAFFNRTKDWADLEEMASAGTLNVEAVVGVLVTYLGADDHRIERLQTLTET